MTRLIGVRHHGDEDPVSKAAGLRLLRAVHGGDQHGPPRIEPCLGHLVGYPDGLLLMDTGMEKHPEVDAHARSAASPRRRAA